jgi:hypothetical protein
VRRWRAGLPGLFLAGIVLAPPSAAAQEHGLPATVVQIAGPNLYLDIGSQQGLAAGDTLSVQRAEDGVLLGRFVVIQTTSTRAVVAFAGSPFAVTRGTALLVTPADRRTGGPADREPRGEPAVGPPDLRAGRVAISGRPATFRGRLALDMNASRSVTHWRSNQIEETGRTFATPALRFNLLGRDLPGDFEIESSVRGQYRHSSPSIVQPSRSLEIYAMNVANHFGAAPLELRVGRFYNRYTRYAGYTDGALLLIGGERLGVGGVVGFLPSRGNQGVSTEVPKYTAFATMSLGRRRVRYATDVSFNWMLPRSTVPEERFAGWSQRASAGRVRASSDFRVDRRATGGWLMTQGQVRLGIGLTRWLTLDARVARYESPPNSILSFLSLGGRRDQAGGGFTVFGPSGTAGVDVTVVRLAGLPTSRSYSGSFALAPSALGGTGLSASVGLWHREGSSTVQAAVGVERMIGAVATRLGYQFYRSSATVTQTTHAGEVMLRYPWGARVSSYLRLRLQRGNNLDAAYGAAGFSTSF